MRSRPAFIPYAIIPLAALIAVLPLLLKGPSCGHDFDFHLTSWVEAAPQVARLEYPHWAFTPAWNAGEPRFIFYPPLSWLLGALLGLILPWIYVPAIFTWVALTLAGVAAFRLCRAYAEAGPALIAAVVYLANPYMLFTAYERTAYGELLAAAILPLLFAATLAPRPRILPLAVPITLLWLTNAPAGVMGCYAVALLTLVRLIPRRSRKAIATTTLAATVLGLTLPAFYLVPAALERRYIASDMAITVGMRIVDSTLFHRMQGTDVDFHNAVVRTASFIALTLLIAIAGLMIANRRHPLALPVAALTIVIALLLTPLSLAIWAHTPQLRFLQFPWRLCALLAPVLALLIALTLRSVRFTSVVAIALAALLVAPAARIFYQPCDDEDAVPPRVALVHSNQGTEPTDEYTPANADPEALVAHDPPFWLIPAGQSPDSPAPTVTQPGQAPTHLVLDVTAPEYLVLNRRQFPLWQLYLNHKAIAPTQNRTDGLLVLLLSPGTDTVDLLPARTPDHTVGLLLSLLAVLIAVGIQVTRSRKGAGEF